MASTSGLAVGSEPTQPLNKWCCSWNSASCFHSHYLNYYNITVMICLCVVKALLDNQLIWLKYNDIICHYFSGFK